MIASISEKADNSQPEQSVLTDDTAETAEGLMLNETTQIDEEQAQRLFFTITHDSLTLTDIESGLKYKADDIFKMILPALERVIRQVERTIKHFSLNYKLLYQYQFLFLKKLKIQLRIKQKKLLKMQLNLLTTRLMHGQMN